MAYYYLRNITKEDIERIKFLATENKEILDFNTFDVNLLDKFLEDKERKAMAIVDLESDKVIGETELAPVGNEEAIFGITIYDKNFLNQGVGTEVTKEMTDYGFREMGLRKVSLHVNKENARAIRCYEKAGFKIIRDLKKEDHLHGIEYSGYLMEREN
jgi:RimJ/RimL family protein N-acetyltransferase